MKMKTLIAKLLDSCSRAGSGLPVHLGALAEINVCELHVSFALVETSTLVRKGYDRECELSFGGNINATGL